MSAPLGNDRIVMTELVKRYGARTVVKGVSADVRRGEVVGCSGPTAPARRRRSTWSSDSCVPTAGTSRWSAPASSRDITRSPMHERARAGIGYLAQENSIFRKLSVGDNLRLIWEMNGVSEEERERRLPGAARGVRALRPRSTRAATRSRAASGGASRSRARSRPNPPFCCSTNRSPGSIRSRSPTSKR